MSTLKVTHLQNENGTGPAMSIAVGGGVTFAGITTFHDAIEVGTGATISGSTNTITASTNNEERVRITSAGDVGIGNENPQSKLQIENAGEQLRLTYPSIASYIHEVKSNGDYAIDKDGTERVRITSGGSLQVKGDVNPNAVFDRGSANTTNVNFNYNGTLTGQLGAANQEFQISAVGSSTPLVAYVNGSERLRITSAGISQFTAPQRVATFTGNGIEVNFSAGSNVFIGTQSGTEGKIGTVNSAPMSIFAGNNYANRGELATNGDFTLHNGNFVVTSGHGINFSATGGAGGTNNAVIGSENELFDDYEYGYWTPTVSSGSNPSSTLTVQRGQYVKIGRQVTVYAYVTFEGGDNGQFRMTNMPYTGDVTTTQTTGQYSGASDGTEAVGSVLFNNLNMSGMTNLIAYHRGDIVYIYYTLGNDGATWTEITGAQVGGNSGGGGLIFNFTYFTNG